TPDEVYRQPANAFVAGFIGSPSMNFLQGRIEGGRLRMGPHEVELTRPVRDGDVVVGLRPEDFLLASADAGTPGRVSARVEIVEKLGPEVLAHFRAEGLVAADLADAGGEAAQDELSDALVGRFDPAFAAVPGDRVELTIRRERLQLFDPASGGSLLG
ncbi:MAG TPA: TOBE domain-containing protein, partial [Gaiellaceae bacterium]|nr:TOBE domain-containing protein [Gaiellaceae bacterium]